MTSSVDRARTTSGRSLLVASTGGHLEELLSLRDRIRPESHGQTWVTFDDSQSRSLLAGEPVRYVPYVAPRGYVAAGSLVRVAREMLRDGAFDRVVSTGAGVALPFLALGRLHRVSSHYIESAARAQGPSLTGRVASAIPGVHLYAQYRSWAVPPWHYRGSVFDAYRGLPRVAEGPITRVVVTLGTMRTYGFRRAIERLTRILPEVLAAQSSILWQVGCTDVNGLGIVAQDQVPAGDLRRAMAAANLVIAHAGVGSAISALDQGKCPVLLRRSASHGEHVDDHQRLIADELAARGLAVSADPDTLSASDLRKAMETVVIKTDTQKTFQLIE